jgi:hypothetical protein
MIDRKMTVAPVSTRKVPVLSGDTSESSVSPPNKRSLTVKPTTKTKEVVEDTHVENNFMRDLDFEGCCLMGLDSILQLNEVHEDFKEITAQHTSMEDGFGDRGKSPKKQESACALELLEQHPELQHVSVHEEQALKRHNNI